MIESKAMFAGVVLVNVLLLCYAALIVVERFNRPVNHPQVLSQQSLWKVRSIDTVKFSRDLAREKLLDFQFDQEIEEQIEEISKTGATHVALGTPYDEEFFPYLARWVTYARKKGLKVWFRGNFSGWEGWFDYSRISREKHLKMTKGFIEDHKEIFQSGDIFTACPECENGGPGDPRANGDVTGFRSFLVEEHEVMKKTFRKIGKEIVFNYNSMNGDVAVLVMDRETTKKIGGVVTIDHYVGNPEKLAEDIEKIQKRSGGKIVLGEFGFPVPQINGESDENGQSDWIERSFSLIKSNRNLIGVNYWTGRGSSTRLWENDGRERKAVEVLRKFYSVN